MPKDEEAKTTTVDVSDALLSQMAQVIVEEFEPERIILFGSHARGDARPGSDIDLLVIEREGFGKARSCPPLARPRPLSGIQGHLGL
ncbi:MAG TPA: nucleotidyltransferase domain-containing protein [Thermoanaerobaculia bacterium]|nr:nucleotidyltransferase domain-containing protein [Thermoanaerobaculia bacterium]